ncbi:7tm Odorant receptor [Popillia japonica]|uniref:Odorant receptor n=1 Tax=Popillia japonica TaxID=7064 RepID=A0AAW1IA97_POPJA
MSAKQEPITKLSSEFSRDLNKDGAKRVLLPAKIILQSMACWPDNNRLLIRITNWFCFYNLFLAEIFHTAYVVTHFHDIGDAVGAGATVTTTMEGLIRLYILIVKKSTINSILVKVWKQFWSLDIIEPVKRNKIRRQVLTGALVTWSFLFFSFTSNTQITSAPYIREHQLILKSVFPFNWNQTYIYEVIYIWQYYCDWFVLFIVNAFDFFFIPLVMVCVAQFVIMQEVLRNILTEESQRHRIAIFGKVKGESVTNREMLLVCLEQHKLLIGICNELESSFNLTILGQFFVSTSAICAATLVLKLDYSQFLKMLMYAAAHLTQLFYYCFAGQQLTYESGRLSDAIYECNWHLSYDRNFRKALVLMIQRSQRVQHLTAAGITELDFSSFLRIMRLSFSFYTLLNNLLVKNNDN